MITEQTVPKAGLLAVVTKKPVGAYEALEIGDAFLYKIDADEDESPEAIDFVTKYCRLFSFEGQDDIRVYSVKDGEHSILLVCDHRNVRTETTGVHFNDVYWISQHTCGKQTLCIFPTHAVKEIKWKS